jgi:PAT family beta-lactamase induction signal transducer AmpG
MLRILKALASPRMAVVLLTGFSSGVPLALTGSTLQAWLTQEGVSLKAIGLFSLVGLPYTLKFVWSPFMDRFVPPFLGRRRGWMLCCQGALALLVLAMGFLDPSEMPVWVAALAMGVAFASASQDIAIDAYRVELLKPEEYGLGSGVYILGYRAAMLFSGAIALLLADHLGWKATYAAMAASMGIGILTTLLAPEPEVPAPPPRKLSEAFWHPLTEFLTRPGAAEILLFIVLYKVDVAMTLALVTPFLIQTGFSLSDIASVNKLFGLIALIAGTLVGGGWMTKLGMKRSLWIFGILQGASGLSFMLLANLGKSYPAMVWAIGVENFCSGMGTAVYSAFLMTLCNPRFTATQYALLSSLMALTRVVATTPTGYLVDAVGWRAFFLVATLSAIPGLLLLLRYDVWTRPSDPQLIQKPA